MIWQKTKKEQKDCKIVRKIAVFCTIIMSENYKNFVKFMHHFFILKALIIAEVALFIIMIVIIAK